MSKFTISRATGVGSKLPNGVQLYHLIALLNFMPLDGVEVKRGDEGGLVQSDANLSQHGLCWIRKGAVVYGKARVIENALVCEGVSICGRQLVKGGTILKAENSTVAAASEITALPL